MRTRNVVLAVLGAVALVLKPAYHGVMEEVVHAHGGNVAVSFALYFAAINATAKYPYKRLLAALAVLAAVEAFEAANGFGFMANVYDPLDFAANAAGVAFAVIVDLVTNRFMKKREGAYPDRPDGS